MASAFCSRYTIAACGRNVDYLRAQLDAAGKSNLFDAIVDPADNHFIPWEHPDAVEKALRLLTSHTNQISESP
jgi:hypothetical protein